MTVQQIYLRISGIVHGPFTKKQILSGLKSNKIPALAELAKGLDGPWEPLAIVLARSSKPKSAQAVPDKLVEETPASLPEAITETEIAVYDAQPVQFSSCHEQYSIEWFKDKIEFIIGDDIRDGNVSIKMPERHLPGWQARGLERIRVLKAELAMLKKEIGYVVQQVRMHYSNKTTEIGTGTGAILASLFVKRRHLGKANQFERARLKMEKQAALAPYENLKTIIAQISHGLDAKKHELKMGD